MDPLLTHAHRVRVRELGQQRTDDLVAGLAQPPIGGVGDLDLIVDSDQGPAWYENIGSQSKPAMQSRGVLLKANLAGHIPTPNVVDWNSDGKLDVIVGAEDGFFHYFDGRYIETLKGN